MCRGLVLNLLSWKTLCSLGTVLSMHVGADITEEDAKFGPHAVMRSLTVDTAIMRLRCALLIF